MRGFSEWMGEVKETNVLGKNMLPADFDKIHGKMMRVRGELDRATEDWRDARDHLLGGGGSAMVSMQELKEWQDRFSTLINELEIIRDDISAGSASAWNYDQEVA